MPRNSKLKFAIATLIAAALFAGCGSEGSGDDAAGTTESKYPEIASMVPDDIRDEGELTIAMSADYPPDHFTENGKLTGFDPEFSKAVGQVLGLDFKNVGTNFEAIIPGLQSGRYDVSISTTFVTDDRRKVIDFVTYFDSGTSLVVKKGSTTGIDTLDSVCGFEAAIEKGTAAVDDIKGQSKKCVDAGEEAVKMQTYVKQSAANLALLSGQADFLAFNTDAAGYAAKKNPQFVLKQEFATFPTGMGLTKGKTELANALSAAVNQLIEDGTYSNLLDKWGMTPGAIEKSEVLD